MSETSSGVPRVPRHPTLQKPGSAANQPHPPVRLTFPSRYHHRFPAPDDEPFDSVNQVEFGLQFFAIIFAMFVATASLAAFVLVPVIGTLFSH